MGKGDVRRESQVTRAAWEANFARSFPAKLRPSVFSGINQVNTRYAIGEQPVPSTPRTLGRYGFVTPPDVTIANVDDRPEFGAKLDAKGFLGGYTGMPITPGSDSD